MTRKKKTADLPPLYHQLFEHLARGAAGHFLARMTWEQLSPVEQVRAGKMLEFKKAAFERAKVLGATVWKNWDFVKDVFFWSPEEPTEKVMAALGVAGRMQAVGRSVLQRATRYRLFVSHRAMALTPEQLDRILLHELVHMGYGGHGADFRAVCREVGGVIGSDAVTGGREGVWFQQKQPNGRYKSASPTFETRGTAMAWFQHPAQVAARLAEAEAWLAARPDKSREDARKALMWRMVEA